MDSLHINIEFWNCAANEVDDLVAYAHILQRYQVILLKHKTLEPMLDDEWLAIFRSERDEKVPLHLRFVHHTIAFTDWGKQNAHFSFDEYKEGGNKLEFGGLLDFEFQDQRPLVEPFAQRLLAIARELYPLARPTYGEIDGGWGEWSMDDVRKHRLKHISWVNFFSPAYVEKYGKDFLLGLPGYKTEELPNGGVFHQLSPTFVAPSEKEAKALRQQVIAYCRKGGLKVTCHAPFVIPGLSAVPPEPYEPASDAEVRAYLKQALATTLVVDDGTRVKPLYIPWDDLTSKQRQMALKAIKETALAEIKRRGRKRIRFEFNAIPDDLDQMLAELVGRDNPGFEWVQVEMDRAL